VAALERGERERLRSRVVKPPQPSLVLQLVEAVLAIGAVADRDRHRFVEFFVVIAFVLAIGLGGMTVVWPAFSSGSMARSSASKPLSAITPHLFANFFAKLEQFRAIAAR
jgi:hypothetical protein